MHGRGSFCWNNGEIYDGTWKNGMPHGRGVKKLALGDLYSVRSM